MLNDLDPVIHPPKRLAIVAILAHSASADFSFLRDQLEVSDSDLSKQMTALQGAGYVRSTKTRPGRGGSTTYRITTAGRSAFDRHLRALRELVSEPVQAPQPVADR